VASEFEKMDTAEWPFSAMPSLDLEDDIKPAHNQKQYSNIEADRGPDRWWFRADSKALDT